MREVNAAASKPTQHDQDRVHGGRVVSQIRVHGGRVLDKVAFTTQCDGALTESAQLGVVGCKIVDAVGGASGEEGREEEIFREMHHG